MDTTQPDTEELIAGYLAGRLPTGRNDAFEKSITEDSQVRQRIEQTLKFKEGLARLRERGELASLLRAAPARRWVPYAAAAAVAAFTAATALWLAVRGAAPEVLVRSPTDLATRRHSAPPILGSYVLARTRGTTGAADVNLPPGAGACELQILPSRMVPGTRYSVTLKPVEVPEGSAHVARLDAGPAGSDGYVTVYVDRSRLPAGRYELSLSPSDHQARDSDADHFVVRVQ